MRRITVLAAAGAVTVAVGAMSYMIGRSSAVREPAATSAKAAAPELVTGTIAAVPASSQAQPKPPLPQPVALPPVPAAPAIATALPKQVCANPDALGVARVVQIDTAGGPGFGFEHFKAYDFLREQEVVLTFDDGPWPGHTPAVLKALADQCAKGLFFPIGKHAMWHPEILKQVAAAGHTVGSHTWSHADLSKLTIDQAKDEFEKGASAVHAVLGAPGAPFFRFPELRQPPEMIAYLGTRNVGIFSTDIDSFDFRAHKPEQVLTTVMAGLKKHGKGIILLHDFQRSTSIAIPTLLAQLKAGGFKIVQVTAKDLLPTLPEYDEAIMKEFGGSTVSARPTSSIVRTIGE